MSITTNLEVGELPPLPSEFTFNYQEFHPELEKWTVFRAMPMLMKYDRSVLNFGKGIRLGTIKGPVFVNNFRHPTLWAYFETLPRWARDHPIIRNVMMAFEYHKPTVALR